VYVICVCLEYLAMSTRVGMKDVERVMVCKGLGRGWNLCSALQILAKGKPEDAVPGISGKQVPLPDEVVSLAAGVQRW